MFRVENNVPDVYKNESRDFQLFSRLYDLVFQASRFSIDSLEQVSDTMHCNDAVLPLIATKVGFFTDLNLTSRADRLILSAFPYIIPYKGSLNGIKLVANLFEQIMNTNVAVTQKNNEPSHVVISFDKYTPNVELLYSLLEYIRPTGLLIDYVVSTNLEFQADYAVDTDHVKFHIEDASNEVVQTASSDYSNTIGYTTISQISLNTPSNTTQEDSNV